MVCCICEEKVILLPGPRQQKYLVTNRGIVHLECYIENKTSDLYPLTRLGEHYVKEKVKT